MYILIMFTCQLFYVSEFLNFKIIFFVQLYNYIYQPRVAGYSRVVGRQVCAKDLFQFEIHTFGLQDWLAIHCFQ